VKRALAAAALAWCGCAYVGEPLPPLLNIPTRVSDLTARQIGGRIRIEFSVPPLNTEGEAMKEPVTVEVKAGPSPGAEFSADAWAAGAVALPTPPAEKGRVAFEVRAEKWAGQEIVLGVMLIGRNGRNSGWSNFVSLGVAPPVAMPGQAVAEAVAEGVRLSWTGQAPLYRVFRRGPDDKEFAPAAEIKGNRWVDSAAEFGKRYIYRLQAVLKTATGEAVSEATPPIEIVPEDRFAPTAPHGLTGIAGAESIELIWEPAAGAERYLVYRAGPSGSFERLAEVKGAPAFGDRTIKPGERYRYAVTALDAAGNESARSEPLEITSP
jgi:hypothetical protein